ncbi:MAG: hypothetical protein HN660_05205 [Flavobacteriaceae bacterium]|nr:hypothetical protein [Flavobacteriaceae bacterium]
MSKPFNIHNWQAKQRLAEDEDKSLQISQEEMEELHKNGKVKLKDGSILAFIKEDELGEMSTTGTGASFNAGTGAAYATPKAFKKKKKEVNEVSYGDFKRNTESSPRQKIAKGIRQVNKMIKEIEKIVSHNFRLKTELDMNSGTFLRSTNKQIHEIGAQLKRLENKIREFSN